MPYFLAAAAAVAAYGAYSGGQTAKRNARVKGEADAYEGALNKNLRDGEAQDIMGQTHTQADLIRAKAIAFRGAQAVQQASSGVMIGEGSAGQVMDQTTQLAMADTLATLYSGVNKSVSIKQGAEMQQKASINNANATIAQGEQAATAGIISAGSSLLGGAYKGYDANRPAVNDWFKSKTS